MLDVVWGARVDDVVQGAHTLARQRVLSAHASLDHALPVVREAFLVVRHALPENLPDRARHARRGEEIECNPEKERARRCHPERIGVDRVGKEHVRDQLQIADALTGIVRDIVQRVPARRAAVRRQRVEQVHVLPAGAAVARGDRPVLLLDVGADDAARPAQEVRNDDPHAFTRPRRRGQAHALLSAQHQIAPAPGAESTEAPKNDPVAAEESCTGDFTTRGKPRIAVKRAWPAEHDGQRH